MADEQAWSWVWGEERRGEMGWDDPFLTPPSEFISVMKPAERG